MGQRLFRKNEIAHETLPMGAAAVATTTYYSVVLANLRISRNNGWGFSAEATTHDCATAPSMEKP